MLLVPVMSRVEQGASVPDRAFVPSASSREGVSTVPASIPCATLRFTSGALVRGSIRRACMLLDLDYREDKGWLDSYFMVSGPADKVQRLEDWARSFDE